MREDLKLIRSTEFKKCTRRESSTVTSSLITFWLEAASKPKTIFTSLTLASLNSTKTQRESIFPSVRART